MRVSEPENASVVSRRSLAGSGAALIAISCLDGSRTVSDAHRVVNGSDSAETFVPGHRLSQAFRGNAYNFYRAALGGQTQAPGEMLYPLAIAIELSLKAYLLHQGVSDGWNRTHIRHDLVKALACAKVAGFRYAPSGLADLAARLTPYYEHHAFGCCQLAGRALPQTRHACATVRSLLCGVNRQIGEESASSVWTARLHREAAYA